MMDFRQKEGRRVVEALRYAGVTIRSIDDLVNTKEPYPKAIPVLLELLPTVRDSGIKEGVVRALTVKEAKGKAEQALIREFRSISPDAAADLQGLKWAIGNALTIVATDAVFNELVELATNKMHGRAREMVVMALGNMKNPKAGEVLVGLLSDEQVAGHAIMPILKFKYRAALPQLEALRKHPNPWVRKKAEKAIIKLSNYK